MMVMMMVFWLLPKLHKTFFSRFFAEFLLLSVFWQGKSPKNKLARSVSVFLLTRSLPQLNFKCKQNLGNFFVNWFNYIVLIKDEGICRKTDIAIYVFIYNFAVLFIIEDQVSIVYLQIYVLGIYIYFIKYSGSKHISSRMIS